MIIASLCNTCFQPFRINLQPEDVHLVKQIADDEMTVCSCPRLCGGKINLVSMQEITSSKLLKEPMSITGRELYQAVNGAGLPDEIPKDELIVEALLKSSEVVGVYMETHQNRVYLHELRLKNGATIHLSSGSRGASVVKITKDAGNGTDS